MLRRVVTLQVQAGGVRPSATAPLVISLMEGEG